MNRDEDIEREVGKGPLPTEAEVAAELQRVKTELDALSAPPQAQGIREALREGHRALEASIEILESQAASKGVNNMGQYRALAVPALAKMQAALTSAPEQGELVEALKAEDDRTCQTCSGTGIDPKASGLAIAVRAARGYGRADCKNCDGTGRRRKPVDPKDFDTEEEYLEALQAQRLAEGKETLCECEVCGGTGLSLPYPSASERLEMPEEVGKACPACNGTGNPQAPAKETSND